MLSLLQRSGLVDPQQRIRFNGDAIAWVDLRDAESRAALLGGSFWPEFPPMVAAFLRGGGEMFDVGANLGLVSLGVLPLFADESTRFHLFEANPRLVELLERSAREWPQRDLRIVSGCVTDRTGVSRFTPSGSHWGRGRIDAEGESVENVRLDDYIARLGIERVGFLKIDVEGWELRVLKGAARSLQRGLVQAGFVEIAPTELERAGTSADEVQSFLLSCGFDLYFAGLSRPEDPSDTKWRRLDVNGTVLKFAPAYPLPESFVQDDLLILHRSNPLAASLRSAFEVRGA